MRKHIMQVNIYGGIYDVEYNYIESQGETWYEKKVIYLNESYPIEHQHATLVHEILHVCFQARWQYQVEAVAKINNSELKEHLIIDPIAISLYDVMKANPKLREWLFT